MANPGLLKFLQSASRLVANAPSRPIVQTLKAAYFGAVSLWGANRRKNKLEAAHPEYFEPYRPDWYAEDVLLPQYQEKHPEYTYYSPMVDISTYHPYLNRYKYNPFISLHKDQFKPSVIPIIDDNGRTTTAINVMLPPLSKDPDFINKPSAKVDMDITAPGAVYVPGDIHNAIADAGNSSSESSSYTAPVTTISSYSSDLAAYNRYKWTSYGKKIFNSLISMPIRPNETPSNDSSSSSSGNITFPYNDYVENRVNPNVGIIDPKLSYSSIIPSTSHGHLENGDYYFDQPITLQVKTGDQVNLVPTSYSGNNCFWCCFPGAIGSGFAPENSFRTAPWTHLKEIQLSGFLEYNPSNPRHCTEKGGEHNPSQLFQLFLVNYKAVLPESPDWGQIYSNLFSFSRYSTLERQKATYELGPDGTIAVPWRIVSCYPTPVLVDPNQSYCDVLQSWTFTTPRCDTNLLDDLPSIKYPINTTIKCSIDQYTDASHETYAASYVKPFTGPEFSTGYQYQSLPGPWPTQNQLMLFGFCTYHPGIEYHNTFDNQISDYAMPPGTFKLMMRCRYNNNETKH